MSLTQIGDNIINLKNLQKIVLKQIFYLINKNESILYTRKNLINNIL